VISSRMNKSGRLRMPYTPSAASIRRTKGALVTAAASPRMAVRVAAAVSARALPSQISDEILLRLLSDSEPSVASSLSRTEQSKSRLIAKLIGELDGRVQMGSIVRALGRPCP
jgi:hypothetical protein